MACRDTCPKGKGNTCCFHCSEHTICKYDCNMNPEMCKGVVYDVSEEQNNPLVAFNRQYMDVMRSIANVEQEKKRLEATSNDLREQLKKAMDANGIKSIDNDFVKITYVEPTTTTRIDSAMLKKKYPLVAQEVTKESTRAGYIKIEVKE